MSFAYLGALLAASAGMLAIDARWRLFFFRDPRNAAIVTAVGVAVLLAWDLAGIATGIFRIGSSPAMTGILLAPHLPLEEIVFLTFLMVCTMVLYTGAARILEARAGR